MSVSFQEMGEKLHMYLLNQFQLYINIFTSLCPMYHYDCFIIIQFATQLFIIMFNRFYHVKHLGKNAFPV